MIIKLSFKAIQQTIHEAIQNVSVPTNWSKSGIFFKKGKVVSVEFHFMPYVRNVYVSLASYQIVK